MSKDFKSLRGLLQGEKDDMVSCAQVKPQKMHDHFIYIIYLTMIKHT